MTQHIQFSLLHPVNNGDREPALKIQITFKTKSE